MGIGYTRFAVIAFAAWLSFGSLTVFAQQPTQTVNVSSSYGVSSSPAASFDSAGVLHVAWADNPGSSDSSTQQVYYSRSSNGSSFETPKPLWDAAGATLRAREIRIATGSAGTVVVAWWAFVPATNGNDYLTAFVARSGDGGATFSAPEETSLRFKEIRLKEGFSNTTSLSLTLTASNRILLLATVQDYYHGYNVYFVRALDNGDYSRPIKISNYSRTIPRATVNAMSVLPSGDIWASWTEGNGDFFNEIKDIYYVVSRDGGQTFGAPQRATGALGAVGAAVQIGGRMVLLTQLQRKERGLVGTYLYSSSDNGSTFTRKRKLGQTGNYSHINQNGIATDGESSVAVAWTENAFNRGPLEGIYFARSEDAGKSFAAAVRLVDGTFIDSPAVVRSPAGRYGVVYTSFAVDLGERDILFRWVDGDSAE